MFFKKDEYLHKYKKAADWIESYNINIIDKKNRIFGFADVDHFFNKKQVEFNYLFIINDQIYKYNNIVPFNGKLEEKSISDKKFSYFISSPQESFQLHLKGKALEGNLKLSGLLPVYVFPTSIPAGDDENIVEDITLWSRYLQRCRTTGSFFLKIDSKKNKKVRVECFAQREHQWGFRLRDSIISHSNVAIQFRDMLMNLSYIEFDKGTIANGIISRKNGNIPVQNVERELISYDKKKNELNSSEFSFTDAQDEVDLVVSKKIHSIQMPVPKNKSRKFIRFRNFSDFTIVGTNKKGVGMEEHYIAIDKIENF
jgi:hypothetical protein